jgi:hypothetical protein
VKTLENNLLETLSLSAFSLYFIFNFIDRSISNIFLLLALLLCIINYKSLYEAIKANGQLVLSVIAFTLYISFAGYYHNSPLNELDNYYRFILLLPLLSLSLNEQHVISVISICAAVGLMHAIDVNAFFDDTFRLHGTSNVVITYANMCATLLMICMYYIFYKNNKSYLLIISAFIFLTLLLLTETRGPFIGIIIISIYLVFILKNGTENRFNFMTPLILIFIFIVSIISIPNPLGERFKEMTKINLAEPLDTGNYYLRNRAYFIIYGIEELQTNYFKGVGPQNIRDRMSQSLKTKNVDKIIPTDHLHNDFLDITVKFGITSLILLFLIYFCIIKTKNKEHRILLNILMIMLLSSQLTQSQFAHHQAITFFITLFYLLREKSNSLR